MGLERRLREWRPVSGLLRVLKQLTRERDTLVRQRTDTATHLHVYRYLGKTNVAHVEQTQQLIGLLDKQVKEIEKKIA